MGAPFDAWLFRRHGGTETPRVATDWNAARSYALVGPDEAPHAEMADSGALRAAEDFRLAALVFSMAASPVSTCWHTHSRSSRSREETGARHGSPRRVSIDICTPSGSRKSSGPSSQAVPLTQEPYDRTLVSDMLRRELGVPAMDEQQKQMDALLGKRGKVAPTPDRVP